MRSNSFFWSRFIPPLCGFVLLTLIWWGIAMKGQIPTPYDTALQAMEVFSHPFHRNGPNDLGVGWNMFASLKRVVVGIPLGFLIGRSVFMSRMLGPVIGVLRPVSPLAWLPIGLLVFKAADPAAIWTIAICSVWPLIINTATGVQRIPQDYLNVARVLNLSELKILKSIVLPAALPHILTGIRLAIGTAWLVIVAAEMLTGGVGIGFWVWDEWNNLNVKNIIIAIVMIGLVGLLLENAILYVTSKLTYSDVGNQS